MDIRYALRQAWKSPGYTLAALVALAAGIGTTTAMFTLVSGVLLRPLPIKDESRVVSVYEAQSKSGTQTKVSMTDFLDWKNRLKSFSAMALYQIDQGNVTGRRLPERVRILVSDINLLSLLGLTPARGRNFSPDQAEPHHASEALLNWQYWKNRFGGEDVLGRQIVIDDRSYTIVGVLPDMPMLFGEEQVWLPLQMDLSILANSRGYHGYYAIGRLRPGVSIAAAKRELKQVAATLAAEHPRENATVSAGLESLRRSITGEYRPALWLLFGFVAAVLLIACVNVASLTLARASSRHREISVRVAIGASRTRLFRQMLTESILLSGVASFAGVVLAIVLVRVVTHLPVLTIPLAENIRIDWRVLLFSTGVALATGIGFGLAPALTSCFSSVNDVLKQTSGRTTESRSHHNVTRSFVFFQSALAALLLVISGLLLKSFLLASHIDPGFDPHGLLTLHISLPASRFDVNHPGEISQFVRTALRNIVTIPGIKQAAVASDLPLIGTGGGGGVVVDGESQTSAFNAPYAQLTRVSPDYFATLRIPLLTGRQFNNGDGPDTTPVVIVNRAFVKKILHGEPALFKRITMAFQQTRHWQIIGVVGDVPQLGIETDALPQVFFSTNQSESGWLAIVVRTNGSPGSYVASIRNEIQKINPGIAVFLPRTMDQIIAQQRGWRAFEASLVTAFAFVAVLLAALGTYAVISYSIAQRLAEIGIRMALGATNWNILKTFTIQGALPAVVGTAVGIVFGFAVARIFENLLYGVRPGDIASYISAVLVLVFVAVAASWIPARRAASIDPSRALRYE